MNSSQLKTNDKSKTFFHTACFPIQCFALNNKGNRVIVSGKNDWELITIGDNSFHSNYALNRAQINLRIMDTCWSRLEESLVVSCGSNGELYKLIVSESEMLIEQQFKFHERAINKIDFHPHEPSILISGGQDGIIKLIDFRVRDSNVVSIFKHDAEDKVTDIQFNPTSSMSHQFASGSENGLAFIWDRRNPSKCDKRFSAHLGRVHLDWHPEEKYWLATASVDKQISVWDMSLYPEKNFDNKFYPINSLTHSESVTSIQWRPQRRTQITACSTGFDSHLYVWDLMRPYVPYASFDSSNKYSSFVWRNSSCILASTRLQLYNTYISEAIRPTEHSTLVSVNIDKYGSVAFAVGVDVDEPKRKDFKDDRVDDRSIDSDIESEKFKITKSVLYVDDQIKSVRLDWFYYSATNYKFKGLSFDELCDYNANVAYKCQKFNIYKDWQIFKTMYKETDNYKINEANNPTSANENQPNTNNVNKFNQANTKNMEELNLNKSALNDASNMLHISLNSISNSNLTTNIITSSTSTSAPPTPSSSDSASDDSLLGSNANLVLNNENKKILKERTINPNNLQPNSSKAKINEPESQLNNYFASNELNMEHDDDLNTAAHIINKFDEDDDNVLLPSDIIEYNDDINEYFLPDKNQLFPNDLEYQLRSSLNNIESSSSASYTKRQLENSEAFKNQSKNYRQMKENPESASFNFSSKTGSSANEAFSNNEEKFFNFVSYRNQINILDENNLNLGTSEEKLLNFDSYFCELLLNYINEQNDLTTAIFMFLVAFLNKKIDKIKIETVQLDEWFSQYIELLSKFELWNLRTEIIKIYQSDFMKNLTQKSINYNIMCSSCKKSIKHGTFICSSCNKNIFLCIFCHLPVKRLYVWCHNCCHGGHVNHMIKWFKNHSKCPSGCGCTCVNNFQTSHH